MDFISGTQVVVNSVLTIGRHGSDAAAVSDRGQKSLLLREFGVIAFLKQVSSFINRSNLLPVQQGAELSSGGRAALMFIAKSAEGAQLLLFPNFVPCTFESLLSAYFVFICICVDCRGWNLNGQG